MRAYGIQKTVNVNKNVTSLLTVVKIQGRQEWKLFYSKGQLLQVIVNKFL